MILFPRAVRVFVATYPVSLRKSFDGLMNEVRSELGHDPLSGHVFVFLNRKKTMVKLLVWTRGGFTIVHKRLERGKFTFAHQVHGAARSVQLEEDELAMLLEGISTRGASRSVRWNPPPRKKEQVSEKS